LTFWIPTLTLRSSCSAILPRWQVRGLHQADSKVQQDQCIFAAC
jgi:hypothetical protein